MRDFHIKLIIKLTTYPSFLTRYRDRTVSIAKLWYDFSNSYQISLSVSVSLIKGADEWLIKVNKETMRKVFKGKKNDVKVL